MKTLQVRHLPDDLHTTLKVRAAQAGMSLSDYVLSELQRAAERPTRRELLERIRSRPPVRGRIDAAALVRAGRARWPMIVLDASAAVELVLATTAGAMVADRIAEPAETIHVPHLLAVEVTQVLRRLVAAGEVRASRAASALDDLSDLDAVRYGHEPFLMRMFALRPNLTAFDATYVALAEVLDAPLVTFDRRLANAPGNHATVELFG